MFFFIRNVFWSNSASLYLLLHIIAQWIKGIRAQVILYPCSWLLTSSKLFVSGDGFVSGRDRALIRILQQMGEPDLFESVGKAAVSACHLVVGNIFYDDAVH